MSVIEYYIDGSTKENTIGAGIVKVNEFFKQKIHRRGGKSLKSRI